MNGIKLVRQICIANGNMNELVKIALKSDTPDPVLTMEYCKASMVALRELYNELKKELEVVS